MNEHLKSEIDISFIVIGYNEGNTLGSCLLSVKESKVEGLKYELIYVDGGSSDNSIDVVEKTGVDLMLGGDRRRKAAENRNLGLASAKGAFIQFLDGDMKMNQDWISRAYAFLLGQPDVAAVCGRIKEAENSFFYKVLQIDWSREEGEIKSCGGAALWRNNIIKKMGGFPEDVAYGEEPYLCWRIRNETGLKIHYLNIDMVDHDLGFSGFMDYVKRDMRCGETYVEIASRCYCSRDALYLKETVSNFIWSIIILVTLSMLIFGNNSTRLIIVICALWIIGRKTVQVTNQHYPLVISLLYAIHTYFSKIPLAMGGLLWLFKRFKRNMTRRIFKENHIRKGA